MPVVVLEWSADASSLPGTNYYIAGEWSITEREGGTATLYRRDVESYIGIVGHFVSLEAAQFYAESEATLTRIELAAPRLFAACIASLKDFDRQDVRDSQGINRPLRFKIQSAVDAAIGGTA